jgi:hypothetical protein
VGKAAAPKADGDTQKRKVFFYLNEACSKPVPQKQTVFPLKYGDTENKFFSP